MYKRDVGYFIFFIISLTVVIVMDDMFSVYKNPIVHVVSESETRSTPSPPVLEWVGDDRPDPPRIAKTTSLDEEVVVSSGGFTVSTGGETKVFVFIIVLPNHPPKVGGGMVQFTHETRGSWDTVYVSEGSRGDLGDWKDLREGERVTEGSTLFVRVLSVSERHANVLFSVDDEDE
jgi:hypothetical protein